MNKEDLKDLLENFQSGKLSLEESVKRIEKMPIEDIGHTVIDHHRAMRNGFPEVIFGENKTPEQVVDICIAMNRRSLVLVTRVSKDIANAVLDEFPDADYNKTAKTIRIGNPKKVNLDKYVAIVTAGTSDLPIAEEAAETMKMTGFGHKIITDVGVAGLHRLIGKLDDINNASVVIVIAGMEGALASVVGGLIDKPIIAVPTSVGYGANFQGVSALLGMLTSCASGITVVNIDNGFGAASAAHRILRSNAKT